MKSTNRFLAISVLALALITAGCELTFTVDKAVTNGASSGPFTVHFECQNSEGPLQTGDLTFTTTGVAQFLTFDTSPLSPTTCDITEPTNAGATSVTFSCVSATATCTTVSGGLQVVAPASTAIQFASITVTNDFTTTTGPATVPPTDATAGTAIQAQPTTTG